MNILILGATGQIGRALTTALATTDHHVRVMVRNADGLNFPDAVSVLERATFTPEAFGEALVGIDHVIYGIGLPEQFQFDDAVFDDVNCKLLSHFLEALRLSQTRRWTYISTYEVFMDRDGQIDESNLLADESELTPYFQSMVRGFADATAFSSAHGLDMTTIHPAAVYGGVNTGGGITDYIENLAAWRCTKVPFINAGDFPVVHVDSLTTAIIASLDKPGAYIVSDEMTTLAQLAAALRRQTKSYVPLVMPLWLVSMGIVVLELIARLIRVKPFASRVQIAFLTKGWQPNPDKAIEALRWYPMPLSEGLRRVLAERAGRGQGPRGTTRTSGPTITQRFQRFHSLKSFAGLQFATAFGLVAYWIAFFTIGVAPANPPAGYYVFQHTFTAADLILSVLFVRSGLSLMSPDRSLRDRGAHLSLVGAGALMFLGALDISFNLQNGLYAEWTLDTLLEALVNVWCVWFGSLMILHYGPGQLQAAQADSRLLSVAV